MHLCARLCVAVHGERAVTINAALALAPPLLRLGRRGRDRRRGLRPHRCRCRRKSGGRGRRRRQDPHLARRPGQAIRAEIGPALLGTRLCPSSRAGLLQRTPETAGDRPARRPHCRKQPGDAGATAKNVDAAASTPASRRTRSICSVARSICPAARSRSAA